MKKLYLIILLGFCWGPSFLFIKIAVREVTPCTLAAARITIAALLLYVVLRLRSIKLKPWSHLWPHFLILGALSSALPFSLISYGEQHISSGLAGLINGSTPVFTVLIAHFSTKDDKMTKKSVLGTVCGFLGLMLIFFPSLGKGQWGSELGILAVIVASLFYAIGMVYAKKYLHHLPKLVAPTWQLIMASALSLMIAFTFERPLEHTSLSWETLGSILALSLIGTVLAFILYFQVLRIAGASYLSFSNLLFPLIAVISGAIFLKEKLAWNTYLGGFFILLGLGITTNIFPLLKASLSKQRD
ncbi:MAG: DMT family transporter [Chlamydiota bacterium]